VVIIRLMRWRRAAAAVALLASAAGTGASQEPPAPPDPAWQPADPIPRRFPRLTDTSGCRWGLDQDGALGLSGPSAHPTLPLFRHAARLSIDNQAYTTKSAATSPDATEVRLTGTAGNIPVVRNIWIDRERGATRWCDTVTNASDQPTTVTVKLDTRFDQPVPGLHRLDGAPLPDSATEAREGVLAFLQNQPEGMASAIWLVADPKSPTLPRWRGKKDSEPHSFEWQLDLPPQGAATLVTWIVQRPALAPDGIKAVTDEFFRQGRLIRPRLDAPSIASLANFPARGLAPGETGTGASESPGTLAPLMRFADSLSIVRGETDVYYMNPKSLLEGDATGGPIQVESPFGSFAVPRDEVAAVHGGGGRGRRPRVFLRDGHVLAGGITLPEWKISGARGWAIALHADTLEALVLRISPTDGAVQPPPDVVVQLTSGDTLPLTIGTDQILSFVTPWGPLETPVRDIASLVRVRQPAPSTLLQLRDGTRLSVLPRQTTLSATSSRLGPVTLPSTDLAALWPPGTDRPDPDAPTEEIASLEDLEDAAMARALLRSSAVVTASLAEPSIVLITAGTETQLNTTDITTLARSESSTETQPVFTVTLASGASFEGILRGPAIALKTTGGAAWSVPLAHFLGWHHGTATQAR
jgi:hypothetical protein